MHLQVHHSVIAEIFHSNYPFMSYTEKFMEEVLKTIDNTFLNQIGSLKFTRSFYK